MPRIRTDLANAVLSRLGDTQEAIWSSEEINGYLQDGLSDLCRSAKPIIDRVYPENRFEHFVCTSKADLDLCEVTPGFAAGRISSITCEDERDLLTSALQVSTPRACMITCPPESELLADISDALLPAVADVDDDVIAIDRALWDNRVIAAATSRDARELDSRYETNAGEVVAVMWQYDGPRTVRKIRRPAAEADVVDVNGSFGLCRDADDVATTDDDVTGTFGIARQTPGHHPMGSTSFGCPRRFYLDQTNVRLEVVRHAASLDVFDDAVELPDRYADYLRDYAMGEALGRPGVGQQPKLAQHYKMRWTVRLARVVARMQRVSHQRVSQLGGSQMPRNRPPSPRLPWPYPAGIVGVR
jgi:hypothetical protein